MYDALLVVTAVACGLVGGVFFAFSTFVTRALAGVDPVTGIRTMQSINKQAVTPPFMALFFGTAALCLVAAVLGVPRDEWWVVAAAFVYVVGCVVVTAAVNVPLNNRVDAIEPEDEVTHPVWADYLVRWVRWNHLRTLSGAVSSGLVVVALVAG